jgi:autoinducer 2 (AI-2) kinase
MARVFVTARPGEQAVARLRAHHELTYQSWRATGVFPTGDPLVRRLNEGQFDVCANEGDRVPANVPTRLETVRPICVARAAPANVDLAAATAAGTSVTNAPGRNAIAVAEHTVGLLIWLIRWIARSTRLVLDDTWESSRYGELKAIELSGRTAGLVGVGHVGREVALRLRAFNVRILGYDPYADPALAASAGVELVGLERLMCESDVVSIHAAATSETEGLVSREMIWLIQPTAWFVTTARGPITDGHSPYDALRDQRIAGAALDVFEDEPFTRDNPLATLDNVLATTHLAGATCEVVANHSRIIERHIAEFLVGRCPSNTINPEASCR